jgi:hypothetical protein
MTQEALKLVLPLLEDCVNSYGLKYERPAFVKAITAIKEALAQPEQEPVAWRVKVETKLRNGLVDVGYQVRSEKLSKHDEPLYTTPPQRTWVGLTDKEIEQLHTAWVLGGGFRQLCNAIEAKLKEKNCVG